LQKNAQSSNAVNFQKLETTKLQKCEIEMFYSGENYSDEE